MLLACVKSEEEQTGWRSCKAGLQQVALSCWARRLEGMKGQKTPTKQNPKKPTTKIWRIRTWDKEAEEWTRERQAQTYAEILSIKYATVLERSSSHILILSLVKYTLWYSLQLHDHILSPSLQHYLHAATEGRALFRTNAFHCFAFLFTCVACRLALCMQIRALYLLGLFKSTLLSELSHRSLVNY